MIDSLLLFEVILLLALAAAGLALFERLRLPAIAGFLVVGALAGPSGLGLVGEPERVRVLAELGVVFLLFEIGLELPFDRLRRLWRTALIAGGVQVVATLAIVAGAANALGLALPAALVLGAVIAMSSTALVMRLLTDRAQVDAPHGQLAVSILILQDLSIVPLLLGIPLLAGGGEFTPLGVALSLGRIVFALAVMVLVVRIVVPRVIDRAARLNSPDLFSLLALLVVLGSAFLAEELGLTLAVGAFLAGVAASASPYSHQLFSEVVPLRGVLLGIFFTAVGMLFDPAAFVAYAPQVLAYVGATVVLKAALVAGICVLLLGRGVRIGVLAGFSLAQTGEFSFVLAEVAHRGELIDESLQQVVIAGSVITLVATPFLFRAAPAVAEWAARYTEDRGGDEPSDLDASEGRVVLIGFGHAGQTLARLLRSLEIDYIVLEGNASGAAAARARGEPVVFGDATRPPMLRRLGVDKARLVAVAISDPLATRRVVSRIQTLAPDTPVLARTRYVRDIDPLGEAGATVVVAEEVEGSLELVSRALELFGTPASAIHHFADALREEGYGALLAPGQRGIDPWLIELLQEVETEWVPVPADFSEGISLVDLGVRARTGATVLAVERAGVVASNPSPDFGLQAGDRLLVLGDRATLAALARLLEEPRG